MLLSFPIQSFASSYLTLSFFLTLEIAKCFGVSPFNPSLLVIPHAIFFYSGDNGNMEEIKLFWGMDRTWSIPLWWWYWYTKAERNNITKYQSVYLREFYFHNSYPINMGLISQTFWKNIGRMVWMNLVLLGCRSCFLTICRWCSFFFWQNQSVSHLAQLNSWIQDKLSEFLSAWTSGPCDYNITGRMSLFLPC